MFTDTQADLIDELFNYGIQMENIEYDGLPSFLFKDFPSHCNAFLVPVIDCSNYIFKIVIFCTLKENNNICNTLTKKIISTNIKNTLDLLYVYYHNFNLLQKKDVDFKMSIQWKKILEKHNYKVNFESPEKNSRYVLKYLLNTSKTEETSYFSK